MQKYLAAVLCLAAASLADVSHLNQQQRSGEANAGIVRQSSEQSPDGSYQYGYETNNGIVAQEQGQLKGAGSEGAAIAATGEFRYTAPDGTQFQVNYIADENGFQPQGAHLPTPPPTPEAILRSIAYNAANPEKTQPQKNF